MIVKPCRHGLMCFNPKDQYVGRSLDKYAEFSQGEIDLFEDLVQPGMVVVDAGANIGAHTIWFAKRAAAVYAFEPQRLVFQMLCANVCLNGLHNVFAFQAGLGEKRTYRDVPCLEPEQENNFGGLSIEDDFAGGETVPLYALDDLGLESLHFLKADVEGMEEAVIRGASQTIERTHPILYLETDRQECKESLLAYVRSLGYDTFIDHEIRLFNPNNIAKETENAFGPAASFNTLCIP